MKKLLSLCMTLAMMLMVGCASNDSNLVSGTFTGEAQGHGGPVTVTLTLKDSVITDVVAEGADETPGLGVPALEIVAKDIVEANSVEVDVVSGATMTSKAVIEATTLALKEAGLEPSDLVSNQTNTQSEEQVIDTDVVIVGAGGAGMTAAITAANDGKKVVVLESQAITGGNTSRSTGGMNASDTPFQDENEFSEDAGIEKTLASAKESYADNEAISELVETVEKQYDEYKANPEGHFDTTELMELDTLVGGKGINDPELVHVLADQSDEGIEFINEISKEVSEDNSGLVDVASFGGASVKRIHRPVNEEGKTISVGAYLVPILETSARDKGVEFLLETTATNLLMDNGNVVGVEAVDKNGNKVTVNAKSVILATGGFGYNLEMVAELNPELDGFCTTNAPGAMGDGIKMAEEVGAATVDMNQIQIHPTVHLDENGSASLITEGLRGDGAILVNKEGKRFFDEVSTRDKVSAAELEQTDGEVWLVVDSRMVDASAVIQGYINKGFTVTGETYEELAEAMGVDSEVFAKTMADWNTCVANKADPEFGRTSFAEPLDQAPYYALTVTPGIHHTMGGVKIDTNAEVLTEANESIPGLYAAGEVTGGVHGANRLGGNAVADIVVFGRIAGEQAANYAE